MSSQSGIRETPGENGAAEATIDALEVISQELMETIRNAHLALEDTKPCGLSPAMVASR